MSVSYADSVLNHLLLRIKDCLKFAIGVGEATATFGEQLSGATCVCSEEVDVERIRLHHAQYFFNFSDSLRVGHIAYRGEFRCHIFKR